MGLMSDKPYIILSRGTIWLAHFSDKEGVVSSNLTETTRETVLTVFIESDLPRTSIEKSQFGRIV